LVVKEVGANNLTGLTGIVQQDAFVISQRPALPNRQTQSEDGL
jgi:hypothetical protein